MIDEIRNSSGEKLDFDYAPGSGGKGGGRWICVLAHGVTGNKDRPLIVDAAKRLNEEGFDTLRFSFAGNGASEGAFEEATISKEVEDLASVMDALPGRSVCCVGHSMGAAAAVLRHVRDERVKALVSLAGMVDTRGFAEREFGALQPGRDVMWEEPDCPLSQAFIDDLRLNVVSTLPQAKEVQAPWLLVHGDADDVVPADDSRSVAALDKPNVSLAIVEGGDHLFNGPARQPALDALADWARRALS